MRLSLARTATVQRILSRFNKAGRTVLLWGGMGLLAPALLVTNSEAADTPPQNGPSDSTFVLSRSTYDVPELSERVVVKVVRNGNLTKGASVDLLTVAGSATPGEDYVPSQTTLHFEPAETNAYAYVQLLLDSVNEPNESFSVVLTNASPGASIGMPGDALVTVKDSSRTTLATLDEASLRSALAQGGLVVLGGSGTVSLTKTLEVTRDTAIDATGVSVTLSGMRKVRVFQVKEGVTLVLKHLIVRDGASDAGAGLYNAGGLVTVANCQFLDNCSDGTNAPTTGVAEGGAVYNAGQLHVTNSAFNQNHALGLNAADGTGERVSRGGAIHNLGEFWAEASSFLGNQALGGSGGKAGSGAGGAIFNGGLAQICGTLFISNSVTGGSGADSPGSEYYYSFGGLGADAEAGAIHNTNVLALTECSFVRNTACGGRGGYGYVAGHGGTARGGTIYNAGLLNVFTNCSFYSNDVVAGSSSGMKRLVEGAALGGGIFNAAHATIQGAVFTGNRAYSGKSAGGALYHSGPLLIGSACRFMSNSAASGIEGDTYYGSGGFDAFGGAVMSYSTTFFTNCAFRANTVVGGSGIPQYTGGDGGGGFGAALASRGSSHVAACSFTLNRAIGGNGGYWHSFWGPYATGGGSAAGAAIWADAGVMSVLNTTIAANYALAGDGGSIPDEGSWPLTPGGDGGSAFGAGIFAANALVDLVYCTVDYNYGGGGIPGTSGRGRGLIGLESGSGLCAWSNTSFSVQNTILAANYPEHLHGSFSGDHNYLASNGIRLGRTTTNSLGTEFVPLMPDHPAIDAARPIPGVEVDQNGTIRPFGSAPDIGATEWNGTSFYEYVKLTQLHLGAGPPVLKGVGPPGKVGMLQMSPDLTNWTDSLTVEITTNGLFQVTPPLVPGESQRFYRLRPVE